MNEEHIFIDQIFSISSFTVNQLIEQIDTGYLGLPELQRPFVWKDSQVRDLLDSMLLGYPVGYLMLWNCPAFSKKKLIGTDTKNYDEPQEVIIDGQQRLTSLYAVINGSKVIDAKNKERDIIISFRPLMSKFEVGSAPIKQSPEWIYNISDLFVKTNASRFISKFVESLTKFREKNGEALTEDEREIISERIETLFNLKQYIFPVFQIKAYADEEAVSQIFVRINSQGVKLTEDSFILTLLSVHWEEGRKEIEKFCQESLTPSQNGTTAYNSMGIKITPKDIIRTVMCYVLNRARMDQGYKLLRGTDFERNGIISRELMEKNFAILKAKLPDVMNVNNLHEFFKAIMNAGYLSDSMIPAKTSVFYTYAMFLIAKYRFNAPYDTNRDLTIRARSLPPL